MIRSSVLFGRGAISVSALAVAVVLACPAQAQSDLGTIEGHVEGVAAGTAVTATDANTGQKLSAKTDAGGNYQIIGIRPSTWTISVDGREPQQVQVLIGQTAVADFTPPAAEGAGKDIIVTGITRREVRTPTVSTNITPAQIENIPQNQRNFLSFAALAPGINVAPGGNSQIQAGATSSSNTNVLIDGMSLKNPINHGGVFGQNFGIGNPFPQSAIQEYKIETQNFDASNGQVGSALVTAITKTGGNSFAGSFFLEVQPNSFITQPYFDKKNKVPKPEYNRKQFGGEFSGPIIKDKLFFYLAGEGTIENLPAATGTISNPPPNLGSQINISHNRDFKQGLYFGKLTLLADDRNTFNLEAFIRRENNLSDIDGNATSSHGRTILTHEDRYQFNWKYSGDNLLNQFNVAYDKSTQSTPSVGTGPEFIVSNLPNNPDFSTYAQLGTNSFVQGDTTKSWTVKDDLTYRAGKHTIRAGAQFVTYDMARTVNDHFNGTYFFYNPGPGGNFDPATAVPYGARINIAPTPTLTGKDKQFGVYVQDEWRPDTHWTFNAGVRWDYETNPLNNDYVTPAKIATALRNYQGWKAVGINPEDYISTGNNRKQEYGMIQPRFGFSYDVKGDRDLVIFGGAGRYFDRSLFIEGVIESLTNSNFIATVPFCTGPTPPPGCVAFNASYRDPNALRALATNLSAGQNGGSVFLLNNKTPMPFSDQIDFGVRKRFGSIQASLTFSHIRSHNIFQFVRANYFENGWYSRYVTRDANGMVTGCSNGGNAWIQDNSPGSLKNHNPDGTENNIPVPTNVCAAQNAQLPGFGGKLDIGKSDGDADYNAIYLTIEKPFTDKSIWGFQTSLTIQKARSNDAMELNGDEVFNATSQNAFGWNYVNGVPKWKFIATGSYRAPLGFILSGTLDLESGPSFGHISFDNPPDQACCQGNFGGVYYPKPFIAYKKLDLRIAKKFELPPGSGQEVTVDFEVFNAFNWLNRTYSTWGAGSGNPAPLIENGQVGNDGRQFQAGIKYKF
jgi:outer membrane receptor protein involved in Fe transport